MSEHKWGPKFRCVNGGCAIIQHASRQGWWRRGGGHSKWKNTPIPPCTGKDAVHCTHIDRVPMALGREHVVRGGIKVGQCDRPVLPRLVVCEHHATPEAVRLVILAMAAEIERLKSGG